ncbi:hypothetical protein RJ639_001816 [Escallonia herrerae]|uniref:Uncharacterized protein n=1 Tax=Escallonia herrerae TaxID=1293975 RepID=A0AA88X9H8_9ASTE|nr:hypothetical protein RJ639_001816 [Escallonia herrerae]
MAVSFSSVLGCGSTAKFHHVLRTGVGASVLKTNHMLYPSGFVGLRRPVRKKSWGPCLLVANGDRVATETSDKSSGNPERSLSDDQASAGNLPSVESPISNGQVQTSAEADSGSRTPEISNRSAASLDLKQDTSSADIKSTPKRSRLTAREKLRAARVLSRKTEPKASKKPQLGSKVLEVLRESDRGKKRSGLPEAPTNLFDDSKRGMPKKGLTFDLPGGADDRLHSCKVSNNR